MAALARAGHLQEGRQARHVLAHGGGASPPRGGTRGGSSGSLVSSQQIQLGRKPGRTVERDRLVRRARQLAWLGIGWHGVEAAVAIGAGLVAGSIALIGFGADSLIE